MTILLRHRGQLKDALEWGQLALDAAKTLDDAPLRMMTQFFTGQAHVILGNYRHAIELIQDSLDAETDTHGAPKKMRLAGPYVGYVPALPVLARAWLAWALAEIGDFADALVQGEHAANAAASVDVPLVRAHGMLGLGIVHVRRGDPMRGVPRLESALQICREADIKGTDIWIAGFLGAGYILANRTAEAVSLLCDTLGLAGQTRPTMSAFVLSQLAQAYALTGEGKKAVELAQTGVDLARRHDLRGYEAWSLYSLAKIYAVNRPPDARESYQQALRLAKTLGMRPIETLSHFGLGQLAHQTRDDVTAREEFLTATALFRDLSMQFWVDKTAAEFAELR
jgi:tetratricopeptide (TPR) repeat protein